MRINYYELVTKISDTYSRVGYSRLWEELDSLKKDLGSFYFDILFRIVDTNFLKIHNSNASTRILGNFSKEEIRDLANKCKLFEKELEI